MLVDVRLENKGENAYNARLNITYTPNLRFSSLIVKVNDRWYFTVHDVSYRHDMKVVWFSVQDNSDIKIECYVEAKLRNEKICNVSAPFMRAKTQVRRFLIPTVRLQPRQTRPRALREKNRVFKAQ